MPAYLTNPLAQVGGAVVSLSPGSSLKLFDGTETPAAALVSIAFNRGTGPLGPTPIVFSVTFPLAAPAATVQIQGSNDEVDGHYQTIYVTTTGAQNSSYSDAGEFAFYRCVLNAYTNGGQPTVIAQR